MLAVVTRALALSTELAKRAGRRASDTETGLATFTDRHGWRSDAGSDITDPMVIAAILAHLEFRAARVPPPTRH